MMRFSKGVARRAPGAQARPARSLARLLAWSALAILIPLAPQSPADAQAGPGTGVKYNLIISCPAPQGFSINANSPLATCPVRAVDGQDEMGDPQLAVDPANPDDLIIASLHGTAYDNSGNSVTACGRPGPSARSRCGQTFTTFTSNDAGYSWGDNPFTPPDHVGNDAYGETPGITIDPYGHVYVGSLYATPAAKGFDFVIAAQKFSDLQSINSHQDGNYHAEYLGPVYPGNAIGQMWFLFDPVTDNMTMLWNEHLTSASTGGSARTTSASSPQQAATDGRLQPPRVGNVVNFPIQGLAGNSTGNNTASNSTTPAPGPTIQPTGAPRGTIGVVWTGTEVNDTYRYQPEDVAIGPCSTSTNPVLSDGFLYVGCVADPKEGPFKWDPAAQEGTIELFRMNPSGGTPEWLGAAPVSGGAPKLGVRSDGRMALLTTQATKEGALELNAAFGHFREATHRIEWTGLKGYGDKLEKPTPGLKITGANVQDLIYREYSGVVHFVLKEDVQFTGVGLPSLKNPVATPHIRKSLVALDENHGIVYHHDLDIGTLLNRSSDPDLLRAPEAAYDDLKDDFLQLPPGDNFTFNGKPMGEFYQREFFAVADYGQVIFAELIEDTDLRGPGVVPVQAAVPALAAPASSLTASAVLLPAAGLVASGLLATSFFVNRRKNPLAAFVKGGK